MKPVRDDQGRYWWGVFAASRIWRVDPYRLFLETLSGVIETTSRQGRTYVSDDSMRAEYGKPPPGP